jgi:polar amino acid transport system substrate-binding protein
MISTPTAQLGGLILTAAPWKESNVNQSLHRAHSLIVALLICLLLAACSPGPEKATPTPAAAGELASVLKNGILVVATDASYPPQSQLDTATPRAAQTRCDPTQYTANQLTGYDIDVAVEIARRLGVEACFVTPTWSQIVGGNWGSRWDIHVGSMVLTAERMQKLYFTQPYISGQAVLFVHKDNQVFHAVQDLSGKRIGVCTGCAYESYLRGTLDIPGEKIEFKLKNAQIVGYDTDTSALADLALGNGLRLDAVMTDPDTGKSMIAAGAPLKQLDEVVYHDYSGVTVDKKSTLDPVPLAKRVTEVIQEMHRDQTLARFSQKYYGSDNTAQAAKFDLRALGQYP